MRVARWAVVVGLVLGMDGALAGEPGRYFSYYEVFTQPEFHDSAGDDDPETVDAGKLEEIVESESSHRTSEKMGEWVKITGSIWDMKMLQAYVTLLSELTNSEAIDLARKQVAWTEKRRARRAGLESWYDIVRSYNYTTRWQVGRLEERFAYGDDGVGDKGNPEMISAPKMYLPKELLFDLDVEAVSGMIEKYVKARKYGPLGQKQEVWRWSKGLWDGQLLVKYVTLLRGLTIEQALELGMEQRAWDRKRFRLYKKFNYSPGKLEDLNEWADEYLQMTKMRIAELEDRMRNLKPQKISDDAGVYDVPDTQEFIDKYMESEDEE